jgi:ferritin-like metal-binding protein YciE
MSLETLHDLFVDQLRDTLSAEKQLVKALPKMAKNANSDTLRDALTKHLAETETQVTRLEKVFEIAGVAARAKHCKGMEGLIEEGNEKLEEDGEEAILDAAIIAAAQRVEHYEIAAYGCLIRYAELLGLKEAVKLLTKTLAEEKAADEKLTAVSDAEVMSSALSSTMASVER